MSGNPVKRSLSYQDGFLVGHMSFQEKKKLFAALNSQ